MAVIMFVVINVLLLFMFVIVNVVFIVFFLVFSVVIIVVDVVVCRKYPFWSAYSSVFGAL